MSIATLYVEELRATIRGRFALIGAGVILFAVGCVATVGTQDTWLDGYGIIAYFLVPLAFIPLTAVFLASPRANRFVESVFTAPVERRDWLIAKLLVVLTLAAAYYVALVPMVLVYMHHVGTPPLLVKLLIWAPCLLLVSIAIGALIGVLFIGESIAAPAATGMGILLAYAGFVPLQELLVAQGNGATRTGHLTLMSPAVLLKNAFGFTLAVGSIPATTTRTWISLLAVVILAFALAVWAFLRAQGVETWEATRTQRWIIALGILAIIVLPVLAADTNYDKPAPHATNAPSIQRLFARGGSSLALTQPGGQPPARCCSTILNRDEWPPFGTDEPTRRDLLVLLPVDATQRVTDVHIQVVGENGLEATGDPQAVAPASEALEKHTYAGDTGPPAADGHHVVIGWVARVPVTLIPRQPWDIGGVRYPLHVNATYHVEGESAMRTFGARAAIDAQVAKAIYEMGAASLILPLICFGAAFKRWRSTK
ncbi:MAG TPA: ABC transporter permease [Candidatus Acidoferrum sp.]|nr:ABC transporter permease [Candidatus Acidoferrum sp.]